MAGGGFDMLLRLGASAAALFALAAVLVGGPDTVEAPDPMPESAIELLGEAWTIEAPRPVERPSAVAPLAQPDASLRSSEFRPPMRPEVPTIEKVPVEPASTAGLRPRPRPRPDPVVGRPPNRQIVGVEAPDAVSPERERAGDGRWVVRHRSSGAVVAELPLAEALALLHAHQRRP
jgi:hypothetical protein